MRKPNDPPDLEYVQKQGKFGVTEVPLVDSGPHPDQEADHELTVEIVVEAYGKPGRLEADVLRRTARAVHHGLGGQFKLRAVIDGEATEWFRYDHLGDDMGHHDGHPSALIPVDE